MKKKTACLYVSRVCGTSTLLLGEEGDSSSLWVSTLNSVGSGRLNFPCTITHTTSHWSHQAKTEEVEKRLNKTFFVLFFNPPSFFFVGLRCMVVRVELCWFNVAQEVS